MFHGKSSIWARTVGLCGFFAFTALFWVQTAQAGPQRFQLCLYNPSGSITAKRTCSPQETVLDAQAINALTPVTKGLAGEPGPQGPQGAKGEKGDPGSAGATGPQGPAGIQGPAGAPGAQGAAGGTGPQGAIGPQGPQGLSGPTGVSGYERQSSKLVLAPGVSGIQEAYCSDGKVVAGGGATPLKQANNMYLHASVPIQNGNRFGWAARYANHSAENAGFEVWALCLSAN